MSTTSRFFVICLVIICVGWLIFQISFIAQLRQVKTDIIDLQIKVFEMEKRLSMREIPKIHCNSATILIDGGEITVRTGE